MASSNSSFCLDTSRAKKVKLNNDAFEEDIDPEVEELDKNITCKDNHTSCVSEKIDALLEVFDEKTCLGMLANYYEILSKYCTFDLIFEIENAFSLLGFVEEVKLPENTECQISGCEFDYSSNTYRLMVILTVDSANIGENFIIVKIDGATGFPKILSIR